MGCKKCRNCAEKLSGRLISSMRSAGVTIHRRTTSLQILSTTAFCTGLGSATPGVSMAKACLSHFTER
jgi:hypothetical protein